MKFGHFDDQNKEYVITSPRTPLPWINYLGCENFFSLVSNTCGGYSFYKDAKLKNITITSKKLKTVGKNVFNGIHKKPVVKLPKSKYTKYVKLLKKAKMPSKVTYKKIK